MNRIVISYRREDSADIAGRIYDHLVARFGRENVFKDVDTIAHGDDFRKAIRNAVDQATVFLEVIGDRWLNATDKEGQRRLDKSSDFVRIEIEMALQLGVRLIPVLVRGAKMPAAVELPETIEELAYRHAIPIGTIPISATTWDV